MWNLTSGNKNSADTINSSCSEEDDDEIKIRGFFSTDEEEAGDEVQLAGFFITKIISNEERVQVYQAKNIGTKETVAIKVVKIEDQDVTKHMAREMMIRDLKHQNVVGLKKVFLSDGGTKLCFVMEFLPMDLGDFMLVGSLGKTHFKQILEGICYLHAQGIIHRDLKPENILIDDDDKIGSCPLVKIADFGLARAFPSAGDGLSPSVGAVGYKAPEILLGSKHYTSAVDIWALGCIFAYSVTRRPLVAEEPDIPTLTQIFSILGKPEEEAWPEVSNLPGYETVSSFDLEPIGLEAHFPHVEPTLFDLLSRMLCLEPSRRITAKAALEHEYFAGMQ